MKYRTIAGERADVHPSITPERIIDAVERGMTTLDPGFCLHCGIDRTAQGPGERAAEIGDAEPLDAVIGAQFEPDDRVLRVEVFREAGERLVVRQPELNRLAA